MSNYLLMIIIFLLFSQPWESALPRNPPVLNREMESLSHQYELLSYHHRRLQGERMRDAREHDPPRRITWDIITREAKKTDSKQISSVKSYESFLFNFIYDSLSILYFQNWPPCPFRVRVKGLCPVHEGEPVGGHRAGSQRR